VSYGFSASGILSEDSAAGLASEDVSTYAAERPFEDSTVGF